MDLVFGAHWDASKGSLNIKHRGLGPWGSSGDEKVGICEGSPFAWEITGIDFAVNRAVEGVIAWIREVLDKADLV
jgi:hypothetical protein